MDNLEELVVSGKELDRKLVSDILGPYLRLDRDSCTIRPLPEWEKLKARSKVLLYLVSRKAMVALGFDMKVEGATAGDVVDGTGMPKGTVNPALRELLDNHFIDQEKKDGRYYIPNPLIERVKSILGKKS